MTRLDRQFFIVLLAGVCAGVAMAICVHLFRGQTSVRTCNGELVLHDHERATLIGGPDRCLYVESPPEHVDYSPALVGHGQKERP